MRVVNKGINRQSQGFLQSRFCRYFRHALAKMLRFKRYAIRFCPVGIVLPGQAVAFGMQLEQYLGLVRPRGREAVQSLISSTQKRRVFI
jgi:hypothetical protein